MNRGFSLIEILIAMAIATLTMSSIVIFLGGDQSIGTDSGVSIEALHKAQDVIEKAAAQARVDYSSVSTSTVLDCSGGLCYSKSLALPDTYATQCTRAAVGIVSWTGAYNRSLSVAATTTIVNIPEMIALGGACSFALPASGWTDPQRFASDTYSPGKPTSIAALNKIVYLGADKNPFFYIVDSKAATLGQTSGLFTSFLNAYNVGAQINSLAAAYYASTNKTYVFAAMNTATNQLKVIDVSDRQNPTTAATIALSACVSGSAPEGWAVYYYDKKVYFVVRDTSGPEFHIFDVSVPTAPTEYAIGSAGCKGKELTNTVESLVVKDQVVAGVTKRYAYMATDLDTKELRVFDVTDPLNPTEVTAANQDLSGTQDGASVFSIGNRLYFGRQSASGSDFFVYDISTPTSGLILLGSQDIGTGVIGLAIAGKFAFIATPKTNQEFQVWNISNLASISNIAKYNFGNVVNNGVIYDFDYIFTTGQSSPNFQIVYSP